MKDLIRKILTESEDDLEWAQELVDKVKNDIILRKNEDYIIKLCPIPINPDTFIYKFNELYGESNMIKWDDDGMVNIFYNENIHNKVRQGKGFIIYVNPDENGISTGWDMCQHLPNVRDTYKILTLEEFLLTTIQS